MNQNQSSFTVIHRTLRNTRISCATDSGQLLNVDGGGRISGLTRRQAIAFAKCGWTIEHGEAQLHFEEAAVVVSERIRLLDVALHDFGDKLDGVVKAGEGGGGLQAFIEGALGAKNINAATLASTASMLTSLLRLEPDRRAAQNAKPPAPAAQPDEPAAPAGPIPPGGNLVKPDFDALDDDEPDDEPDAPEPPASKPAGKAAAKPAQKAEDHAMSEDPGWDAFRSLPWQTHVAIATALGHDDPGGSGSAKRALDYIAQQPAGAVRGIQDSMRKET